MSLNWDLTGCENSEELLEGSEWGISETVIYATIGCGIGTITEKNEHEFYARIKVMEKLYGALMNGPSEDGTESVPRLFTFADIHRRIGLVTNVFPAKTRAQWLKQQVGREMDDTIWSVKRVKEEVG